MESNFSEKQHNYLEACRAAPYLTQAQRARKVRVDTATVSGWKQDPTFAAALAGALADGKRSALSDLDDKVAKQGPKALAVALDIMRDGSGSDHARLNAATYLLDRVLGKPKQTQELTGKDGGPIEVQSTWEVLVRELHDADTPDQGRAAGGDPTLPN